MRKLDEHTVADIARRLEEAERDRVPLTPVSIAYPDYTFEDAYAVQEAWIKLKLRDPERSIRGHKIGLTSRAMQSQAGIDTPDSGVLLDDMIFHDGAVFERAAFLVPRIEVELCFILGKDLHGPGCTIFDVLDATDWVSPALELIDTRFHITDPETGLGRKVVDTISDNACNAAIIIGGNPVRPTAIDLRWASALCYRNNVIEESGVAAAVLGHPANGIVWLANRMAATGGDHLRKGQIVLAGSFTRPMFAEAGDHFHADYGPLGAVTCSFR